MCCGVEGAVGPDEGSCANGYAACVEPDAAKVDENAGSESGTARGSTMGFMENAICEMKGRCGGVLHIGSVVHD